MKIAWADWSRSRKVLSAVSLSGGVLCVVAFLPSPASVLASFASVPMPEVKMPPAIALTPPPPLDRFRAIAERPLFNVNRKPDPIPPPLEAAKPAIALGDLAQLRLVGIIASKGAQLALVRRADGQVVTLRADDTLDGWTIEKIDTQGVVLIGGDRRETLKIPQAENQAPVVERAPPANE